MVRKPDAATPPTPQDNQLMSKHRVLSLEPQLRLEWRGQDGQNETEQPDHSASLGDSITPSTRIRFSMHTGSSPPICKAESETPSRRTAFGSGIDFSICEIDTRSSSIRLPVAIEAISLAVFGL